MILKEIRRIVRTDELAKKSDNAIVSCLYYILQELKKIRKGKP